MRKRRRKPFLRYFTVAEANALLPELRVKLLRLQAMLQRLREEYGEKAAELLRIASTNGKYPEWSESSVAREIHRAVEELHAMGVLLRDIEQGIVDFPHLRNGREVLLCWRLGEERVEYYHELDTSFRMRKPLWED
ncbi:MAG: DUF2203 domain-containing protein [Fimbriimonadales bacterium]|nr:DUF2203 domain-containing protein [Fimbriimonadales bacterium]MDW8052347.1 DUF2203 domain-containing protein [Armatimonadota bacterium]